MLGPKSKIYISICQDHTHHADETDDAYRKPRHLWMISVSPQKHNMLSHSQPEPTRFVAAWNEEQQNYVVQQAPSGSMHGIIGNVLITQSAHTSPAEVEKLFKKRLEQDRGSSESSEGSEVDADRWIRHGLHILQEAKAIERFDAELFMTFAHAYIASRLDRNSDAPAMIAYQNPNKTRENKVQESKAKKGFWMSYPTAQPSRGDRIYGGLM